MTTPRKIRRQIFVLTPEEKKAVACVLAVLLLGVATQHYRARNPRPAPPPTPAEERAAKLAERAAATKERTARRAALLATPQPPIGPEDQD